MSLSKVKQCLSGPYMWPKAISMIANGDLPMEKIISHVFPLQDFKKGIEMVFFGIHHPHTKIS